MHAGHRRVATPVCRHSKLALAWRRWRTRAAVLGAVLVAMAEVTKPWTLNLALGLRRWRTRALP